MWTNVFQMEVSTTFTAVYLLIDVVAMINERLNLGKAADRGDQDLTDSINRHAMVYFIVANLSTGLVNMVLDRMHSNRSQASVTVAALVCHMLLATIVVKFAEKISTKPKLSEPQMILH